MRRESIIVLGIALSFYALGGYSIYGQAQRERTRPTSKWRSTEAIIAEAYRRDIREHELHRPTIFGYKYIVRGITYTVNASTAQQRLAEARLQHDQLRVQYKPEDPTLAVLAGDPTRPGYLTGLGLIGVGTLVALLRELVLRRRGHYHSEAASERYFFKSAR